MRKLILAILIVACAVAASGRDGRKTTEKLYYENNEPESAVEYRDGKKNGAAIVYSRNGMIKVRGSFKNDRRHGLWTFYFDETPTLMAVEFYENDRLQGRQSYFYPDGSLRSIANYEDNQRKGVWEWYSETGALETRINYLSNYRGLAAIFNDKGVTVATGMLVNELRSGLWKFFDESGRPLYAMNYRRGVPYGDYEAYDRDGSVVIRGLVDEAGNLTTEIEGKQEIIETYTGR
ncbi:MAG: hypothetical protein LBQ97_07235 [Fusobacteriaceae bacterium]|jgi:antitoxin component YwqK of YwqJK toxin-antitoxin module|nr:hypothetical protein [Fusobacteriaceae bacterium]